MDFASDQKIPTKLWAAQVITLALSSLALRAQEQVGPEIGGNPVGLPFTMGSLLYGSSSSQPTGIPASGSGMVLQGGQALPVKGTHNFIIQPTQ